MVVRPFRPEELEAAVEATLRFAAGAPGGERRAREHRRRRLARSGRWTRGTLDLAVEAAGRPVGDVQARRSPGQVLPPGVAEIGIALWDPADRGRGYGTEAVGLLTGWLLRRAGVARVQLSTAAGNAAMVRSAEKLGFRFEGVLRSFMPSGDGREDYLLYAVTGEDWGGSPPPRGATRSD